MSSYKTLKLTRECKAALTLLIREVQDCETKDELNTLLESWTKANDLHPEEVITYHPDFERWKHYIGIESLRGEKLTEGQLWKWANDPNRLMECIFCQIIEPPSFFRLPITLPDPGDPDNYSIVEAITCCPRCKEYKGIQPHIPGWSNFEGVEKGG